MRSKMQSSWNVVYALMLREMNTRHAGSWGGYMWAIVEPVSVLALLSIIFSYYFSGPPIGSSFPLFYATGLLPFLVFSEISSQTANALAQNKTILYFPPVTPLDTILARFLLSCITLVVVSSIVLLSIFLILKPTGTFIHLPVLVSAMTTAAVLGLGVGTTNAAIFILVPAWKNIWSILSRPLFLVSGIFFIYEQLPVGVQGLLWWNPLIHTTGTMRSAFYPDYSGEYLELELAFFLGVALFIVGASLLEKNRSRVVESG